jgi:uncharacterized membrane protein
MELQRNTSLGRSKNLLRLLIKIALGVLTFFLIIIFVNKIDFPSPNKTIEKKLPDANLKIVK